MGGRTFCGIIARNRVEWGVGLHGGFVTVFLYVSRVLFWGFKVVACLDTINKEWSLSITKLSRKTGDVNEDAPHLPMKSEHGGTRFRHASPSARDITCSPQLLTQLLHPSTPNAG
jgi:hypothetical protein